MHARGDLYSRDAPGSTLAVQWIQNGTRGNDPDVASFVRKVRLPQRKLADSKQQRMLKISLSPLTRDCAVATDSTG